MTGWPSAGETCGARHGWRGVTMGRGREPYGRGGAARGARAAWGRGVWGGAGVVGRAGERTGRRSGRSAGLARAGEAPSVLSRGDRCGAEKWYNSSRSTQLVLRQDDRRRNTALALDTTAAANPRERRLIGVQVAQKRRFGGARFGGVFRAQTGPLKAAQRREFEVADT